MIADYIKQFRHNTSNQIGIRHSHDRHLRVIRTNSAIGADLPA